MAAPTCFVHWNCLAGAALTSVSVSAVWAGAPFVKVSVCSASATELQTCSCRERLVALVLEEPRHARAAGEAHVACVRKDIRQGGMMGLWSRQPQRTSEETFRFLIKQYFWHALRTCKLFLWSPRTSGRVFRGPGLMITEDRRMVEVFIDVFYVAKIQWVSPKSVSSFRHNKSLVDNEASKRPSAGQPSVAPIQGLPWE